MKNKTILAILLVPMSLAAELPDPAAGELEQLGKWESEQLARHQERLKLRRAEAIGALTVYLKLAKSEGDKDGAAEIQKEIERLRKAGGNLANSAEGKLDGKPRNDAQLRNYLSGTSWEFSGGRVLTLQADGSVLKSWGKLQPDWRVVDMKVRFEGKLLVFNKDFTEATETTKIEFQGPGKLLPESRE